MTKLLRRSAATPPILVALDALVLAMGAGALLQMLAYERAPDWTGFSVILLLACIGTRMRLHLPGLEESLSLWFPFGFAAILEQPAWAAFVVLSTAGIFDRIDPGQAVRPERSRAAVEALYFIASTALATMASTLVASWIVGDEGLFWAVRAALAAVVYFLVWSLLAALRRALETDASPWTVWNRQYFWASPIYLLAPCGALVAGLLIDGRNVFDTLLGLSVIACAYWYLQTYFPRLHEQQDHIEKLARVREKALETLAVAIEAKDGSTAGHLERVKLLAGRLARELGCSADEQRTLELAAVLHDVGKIGVSDSILSKPGRLTEAEFRAISAHANIGADIVASMEFPDPVDAVVRCHHEHWDGSGYPAGISGQQIPRLARILTVVDCFDALVSHRPYRKPLSIEQAAELMRQQRRKIFDPEVLDVFLEQVEVFAEEIKAKLAEDSQAAKRRGGVDVSLRQTWIDHQSSLEHSAGATKLHDLMSRPDLLDVYQESMSVLGSDLDFESAFEATFRRIAAATHARAAGLFDFDEGRDAFVLRSGLGLTKPQEGEVGMPANQGLAAEAARRGLPLVSSEAEDATDGLGVAGSKLAAPLFVEDQLVGLVLLGSDDPNAFAADEIALMTLLSPKLALTLQAADDLRRIRIDAHTDPVTQLPNAGASLPRLEQEVQRAEREHHSLGVLFMDLNGLKMVNDTYGHYAGNRLLLETGRKLRGALRSYDFVGRLGGDEFLALLPGISIQALRETAAKLKEALQEEPVRLGEHEQAYAMISVGEAHYPTEANTARELLTLSDGRMYTDKADSQGTPPVIGDAKALAARLGL